MSQLAELADGLDSRDPTVGLAAVAALRLLVDEVEATHVQHARSVGWPSGG